MRDHIRRMDHAARASMSLPMITLCRLAHEPASRKVREEDLLADWSEDFESEAQMRDTLAKMLAYGDWETETEIPVVANNVRWGRVDIVTKHFRYRRPLMLECKQKLTSAGTARLAAAQVDGYNRLMGGGYDCYLIANEMKLSDKVRATLAGVFGVTVVSFAEFNHLLLEGEAELSGAVSRHRRFWLDVYHLTIAETPDYEAWGEALREVESRALHEYFQTPEGRADMMRWMGADAPSSLESRAVYAAPKDGMVRAMPSKARRR